MIEIYLDNSATTRPFDEVIDLMDDINRNTYGNPSSLHRKGIEAEKRIKAARLSVANTLGADSREIIFTSGGTESNNLAIRGYLEANPRKGKRIVTTMIEHPSVLETFKYMSSKGYEVEYLQVDSSGAVDMEDVRRKVTADTALVSLIYINNETGAVQPIKEISKLVKSIGKDIAIHVDAVQAYGKISINPSRAGIDMMSMSSHKIHGPKGTGALYVNRNIRISPILFGGGQETLLRSGTENVAGICGFGLAADIIYKNLNENLQKTAKVNHYFRDRLMQHIANCSINSPEQASPYILNVSFERVKSEVLLHHLEERNIFVSTGSACSSRKNIHSHVLKAMGLSPARIDGAIRFSFSALNTEEELTYAVDALTEILPRITIQHGGRK